MIGPDQLILLAERLVQGASEEEWRAAVSRAYYAAFHTARELLGDLGFRVPASAQAHSYLWMRLSNCGDASVSQAGADLNNLQRERNRADYDIHQTAAQVIAQQWVQKSRGVLTKLRTAAVGTVRAGITTAMRDYERNVLRHVTWQGP